MEGERIAFAGRSQYGKTTYGKKLMLMDRKPHYILSIKPNFDEAIYVRFSELLKAVKGKKDIFIFIDEAKSFIKKDENYMERHYPDFFELLRMAKEYNIIIIMVFHALREIPSWLVPHLDRIERWETQEDKAMQARRLADYENVANSLIKRPHLEKFEHVSLII